LGYYRSAYKEPTLESFCDTLIRAQVNIFQLGVIGTISTSNKALVAQKKYKYKHPKKQHPCNNKKKKGLEPPQPTSTPNGDKGKKYKSRRLIGIATCVSEMVMWSLNVLKIWNP
jgi:hypothetical protein